MKTLEAKIYTQDGKDAGKVSLPEHVFGLSWNADLVHQVITSMNSSARKNIAHTKTRGEVAGGGKKPWKQKGTGRARHGSIRSPLWPGGGITHGPRNDKNYDRKVNKKVKAKALFTILSKKFKDGEILFVDSLSLKEPKTKIAKSVIKNLSGIKGFEALETKRKNAAYITTPTKDKMIERSFNNMSNVEVDELRNINPVDIMKYKYLVISSPASALEFIGGKLSAPKK